MAVTDFGSSHFETSKGSAIGTLAYTAPERFLNFSNSERSGDVFSFGVILWVCIYYSLICFFFCFLVFFVKNFGKLTKFNLNLKEIIHQQYPWSYPEEPNIPLKRLIIEKKWRPICNPELTSIEMEEVTLAPSASNERQFFEKKN